jgi:hypothetical protein
MPYLQKYAPPAAVFFMKNVKKDQGEPSPVTDAEAIEFRKAAYYSIGNDGHGIAALIEVSWWPKHWDSDKMDASTIER